MCRSLPVPQVDSRRSALRGSWRASASGSVASASPARSASSITASSHTGPSYHQWPSSSVSSAQTTRAGRARAARYASARRITWSTKCAACSRARRVGGVAVVGPAAVRPCPHAVDRLRVVVPVDRVRRVAAVVPHQRNRAPVERDGDRTARGDRLEVVERIGRPASGRRRKPRTPARARWSSTPGR